MRSYPPSTPASGASLPKGAAPIGEGRSAVVYRVAAEPGAPSLVILKRTKATSIYPRFVGAVRRADGQWELPAKARAELAAFTADVAARLRSHPALQAIVPETVARGEDLLQEEARGLPLKKLPEKAQADARRAIDDLVARAAALLPEVPLSDNPANFRFDAQGRVTSWFDWVSASAPAETWARWQTSTQAKAPATFEREAGPAAVFDVDKRALHLPTAANLRTGPLATLLREKGQDEGTPRERLRKALATAKTVGHKPLQVGKNGATLLELDGGIGAVFKASAHNHGARKKSHPHPERIHQHEVGASRVNNVGGFDLVPETVERTEKGEIGSCQLFVDDCVGSKDVTPSVGGAQLDRAAGEALLVFDFLVGNGDRNSGNLLVRAEEGSRFYKPVAIDNGLAFPEGPWLRLIWPGEWMQEHAGPLLDATRTLIEQLDPNAIARNLARAGLSRSLVRATLYRLERLQHDPSFLEQHGTAAADVVERREKIYAVGCEPEKGLKVGTRARIDAVLDRYYGRT